MFELNIRKYILVHLLFRSIVMYDFAKYLPMMDQLITGLGSFGVIDAARENKVVMEALFVVKHSINFVPTADQLLDSIDGVFGEDGSNHKEKEIDIFKYFCDFLQDSDELQGKVYSCRFIMNIQQKLCLNTTDDTRCCGFPVLTTSFCMPYIAYNTYMVLT